MKTKTKKRYKKSAAVKKLEALKFERKKETSSMPLHAIPKTKYEDKTANGLTKCIVDYINLQPACFAYRVNNMGVYDSKLKGYRISGTIKGIADVSAIRNGEAWQIEVKKGADRLSDDQKRFKERVESSNGVYCVAKTFDGFLQAWEEFKREKQ